MATNVERVLTQLSQSTKSEMPRSIVIGGSFGGLSTAFSLSCRGHEVIIIDNRGAYTLEQRIFVPETLIEQFYRLSDLPSLEITFTLKDFELKLQYPSQFKEPESKNLDLEFFRLLEQQLCIIPIKDFQNYQLKKFKNLLHNSPHFTYLRPEYEGNLNLQQGIDAILEIATALSSLPTTFLQDILTQTGLLMKTGDKEKAFHLKGPVQFLRGPEYKIVAIDGENQIITLEVNHKTFQIPFDHLIAADGSNHAMADLLFANNPQYKIPLKELPLPKHNAYGTINFKLNNISPKTLSQLPHRFSHPVIQQSPQLTRAHLPLLQEIGWSENYLPLIYLHIDKKNQECYITGEIPKDILTIKTKGTPFRTEKDRLQAWFSTLGNLLLNLPLKACEITHFSVFQTKTQYFEKNHITLGKGGKFILVGDNFLAAHFLYGHGIPAAIGDGNAVYLCFNAEGQFISSDPLDTRTTIRRDEYNYYTTAIEAVRMQLLDPSAILKQKLKALASLENVFTKFDENRLSNSGMKATITSFTKTSLDQAHQDLTWMREMIADRRNAEWESQWLSLHGNTQDAFALVPHKNG